MEVISWLLQRWFDLVQTLGIIATLLFTAYSFQKAANAQRMANQIAITEQYREIRSEIYERPQLGRVDKLKVDLIKYPITDEEWLFVKLLIFHLNTVYQATEDGLMFKLEGLQKDVKGFFEAPIPKAVWEKIRTFQDHEFVAFVEQCLSQN